MHEQPPLCVAVLGVTLPTLVVLWVDPVAAGTHGPFELPPLGGRFNGAWSLFLAVLAAWPALFGRRREARLALLGLAAFPAGALLAAVWHVEALPVGYALALIAVIALGSLAGVAPRAMVRS